MIVTTAFLLLWVAVIFVWVIWTNKWRGVLQCAIVVAAVVIIAFGDSYSFNGKLWAVVFLAIVLATVFAAPHFLGTKGNVNKKRKARTK